MRLPGDRDFEVIVVGGGHAGCEAALAAARLGASTLLISLNLDSLAQMPCNCSIGGPGKAHLVSEIVALGGEMGRNIDRTFTHIRVLNATKGPAVQALRAQADKRLYRLAMKQALETQPNLSLWQDMVVGVEANSGRVTGVHTGTALTIRGGAVVVTAGTFLNGLIHIGEISYPAGRAGESPSTGLTESLQELGLQFQRFKTGTVPRVLKSSLNLHELALQPSDQRPLRFHHSPVSRPERELLPCWITRTIPQTHELLRANFHRSSLVSGRIEGTGPRYCPSIEAKLLRFPGRDHHTVFLEQEGWDTEEIYVQGVSSSMPAEVQLEMLHSMPGLAQAVMMRPGYAIEYDCIDARQLDRSLAYPLVPGLYLAGQVNGTSGYEEAAAQGLIAGINAVKSLRGEEPLVISRAQGYIGVIIDDLVSKGTEEPYRMLTARAERRLVLGQSSALRRIGPLGLQVGLLPPEVGEKIDVEEQAIRQEITRLQRLQMTSEDMERLPGATRLGRTTRTAAELLQQGTVSYAQLVAVFPATRPLSPALEAEVATRLRYAPYWKSESKHVERSQGLSRVRIPPDFGYAEVPLRQEARERLAAAQPTNLEQAAVLTGVTPADLATLRAWLERK